MEKVETQGTTPPPVRQISAPPYRPNLRNRKESQSVTLKTQEVALSVQGKIPSQSTSSAADSSLSKKVDSGPVRSPAEGPRFYVFDGPGHTLRTRLPKFN